MAGAIIGLVTSLLGNGLPIMSYLAAPGLFGGLILGGIFGCPFFSEDWSGNPVGPAYCGPLEWTSVILLNIVLYFIVGAILGLIYGKFRRGNSMVSR